MSKEKRINSEVLYDIFDDHEIIGYHFDGDDVVLKIRPKSARHEVPTQDFPDLMARLLSPITGFLTPT